MKILSRFSAQEIFIVLVILGFGLFFTFTVPLGAGFDEETHLLRVWEMSAFAWIPNSKLSNEMHFPAFYWDNSYRRQVIIEPVRPNFWKENADMPIDGKGYVEQNLTTRSVYSPLLLLPHSLIMYLFGRVLELPALVVLVAMRVVGLLCYLGLVWLAVRMAPFGKWMWAIMVIAPMAVYQASTVTTDTISNGIGFLFVSGCLVIARHQEIKWKEWLLLLFLFFLLFFTKLNLVFLAILPFLLLPPSRYKMKYGSQLLGIAAVCLFLLEVAGWNLLAYTRLFTAQAVADPINQVMHIITHPFTTLWVLISDLRIHLLTYVQGWIADLGYGYWGPHWFVYITYGIALLFALIVERNSLTSKRIRISLLFTFGLSFLVTMLSMYILYNPVGSTEIQEIHGRYFSVIIPLLLLGIVGIPFKSLEINQSFVTRITIGFSIISLLIFSVGGYLAYYCPCGAQFYRLGSCFMPVYKNWAPDEVYFPPISSDNELTQWIMSNCSGMHKLRVWIDSTNANPNGETEFLLERQEDETSVINSTIPNTNLPIKDWITFDFPTDWNSGGSWYTLTIKNSGDDSQPGIRVASSIQAEYIDAPLYQNGNETDKDMIFQYGCIAGWQKLIPKVVSLVNNQLNR